MSDNQNKQDKSIVRPSKARGIAAHFIWGLLIIAFGVHLLLGSLEKLPEPLTLENSWLIAFFATLWLMGFTGGILRKNPFELYVGFIFFTLGLMFLLNTFTELTFKVELWPMLIAIPAVSSFFALWPSRVKRFHVKCIILSASLALFWFLYSTGVIEKWWIVLIICVIVVGLFVIVNAVTARKGQWDDGDRPQRKRY